MKRFIVLFVALLSGCAHYSRAQVGPDRYSFSSPRSGSESHTLLLKNAYETCKISGYKDYVVLYSTQNDEGMNLLVQCTSSPMPAPPTVVRGPSYPAQADSNSAAAPTAQVETSWSDKATKLYDDFKATLK